MIIFENASFWKKNFCFIKNKFLKKTNSCKLHNEISQFGKKTFVKNKNYEIIAFVSTSNFENLVSKSKFENARQSIPPFRWSLALSIFNVRVHEVASLPGGVHAQKFESKSNFNMLKMKQSPNNHKSNKSMFAKKYKVPKHAIITSNCPSKNI